MRHIGAVSAGHVLRAEAVHDVGDGIAIRIFSGHPVLGRFFFLGDLSLIQGELDRYVEQVRLESGRIPGFGHSGLHLTRQPVGEYATVENEILRTCVQLLAAPFVGFFFSFSRLSRTVRHGVDVPVRDFGERCAAVLLVACCLSFFRLFCGHLRCYLGQHLLISALVVFAQRFAHAVGVLTALLVVFVEFDQHTAGILKSDIIGVVAAILVSCILYFFKFITPLIRRVGDRDKLPVRIPHLRRLFGGVTPQIVCGVGTASLIRFVRKVIQPHLDRLIGGLADARQPQRAAAVNLGCDVAVVGQIRVQVFDLEVVGSELIILHIRVETYRFGIFVQLCCGNLVVSGFLTVLPAYIRFLHPVGDRVGVSAQRVGRKAVDGELAFFLAIGIGDGELGRIFSRLKRNGTCSGLFACEIKFNAQYLCLFAFTAPIQREMRQDGGDLLFRGVAVIVFFQIQVERELLGFDVVPFIAYHLQGIARHLGRLERPVDSVVGGFGLFAFSFVATFPFVARGCDGLRQQGRQGDGDAIRRSGIGRPVGFAILAHKAQLHQGSFVQCARFAVPIGTRDGIINFFWIKITRTRVSRVVVVNPIDCVK